MHIEVDLLYGIHNIRTSKSQILQSSNKTSIERRGGQRLARPQQRACFWYQLGYYRDYKQPYQHETKSPEQRQIEIRKDQRSCGWQQYLEIKRERTEIRHRKFRQKLRNNYGYESGRGSSGNYVINIEKEVDSLKTMMKSEKRAIRPTAQKAKSGEIDCEALVPCAGSLFQPIGGFAKTTYMIMESIDYIARG